MSEEAPKDASSQLSELLEEENERLLGRMMGADDELEFEQLKTKLEGRFRIVSDYESGTTPTYASYADALDILLTKTEGIEDAETESSQRDVLKRYASP